MKVLVKNRIGCKACGDVIESKYSHDFKWCKCGSVAVDGGRSYLRRVGKLEDIIEMSEYSESDSEADSSSNSQSIKSSGGSLSHSSGTKKDR